MRWRLPAKLNWDLRVLGRRQDGFHELRSWFLAVDWYDKLQAAPSQLPSFSVSGPAAGGVPAGAGNLVLRAERAWRAAGGEAAAIAWRLHKEIPAGGGLGGGSSDAAGALLALQALARRPLDESTLCKTAATLGSDVPFFLEGSGAQLRGGRGERLLATAPVPPCWFLVAVPPVLVESGVVYGALQADAVPATGSDDGPAGLPERPGPNDLETPARRRYRALDRALERLAGFAVFTMSGSGAAAFTICGSEEEGRELAARVLDGVGGSWRLRVCRALGSGCARPEERSWP